MAEMYDYNAMQVDRNSGMKVKDISAKYGCSDVTVYARTVDPRGKKKTPGERHDELQRVKAINWAEVQNARTEGATVLALSEKYGVSKSTIHKHTKKVKGAKLPKWAAASLATKTHKHVAVIAHVNGTANSSELVKQALVSALAEREKLNKKIEQLEAIVS